MDEPQSTIAENDLPLIVLAAEDPNIALALLSVVSSEGPERNAQIVSADRDWRAIASKEVLCAFVDAPMLTPESLAALSMCRHLVIFNVRACRPEVTRLLEDYKPKTNPIIEQEDFLLTELLLRKKYQALFRQSDEPPDVTAIDRVRSVDPSMHTPLYENPALRTPEVAQFFNHLRSGIIYDPERLATEFISVSSARQIPPEQVIVKYQPTDLKDVEERLRAFARTRENAGVGCFLIGKKGVGKSTLAYYVGRMEDLANHVCCIGLDYTLEGAHNYFLYDRLGPLLSSLKTFCEGDLPSSVRKHPQTLVFRAAPFIDTMIDNDDYDAIRDLSPEARRILQSESDRGFLIRMYCHYTQDGLHVEEAYETFKDLELLSVEAENWYEGLCENLPKALAHYTGWILRQVSTESLTSYSYLQTARYLLTSSGDPSRALSALAAAADRLEASERVEEELRSGNVRRVLAACRDLNLSHQRSIVLDALEMIADGRPLLFLLDNIDQRTSEMIEARLIFCALNLFEEELLAAFPNARAIVSMRDTTFDSHEWVSIGLDVTRGWPVEHVAPPDLLTLLERRSTRWLENVAGSKEDRDVSLQMDISRYLSAQTSLRRRAGETQGLVQIIEHRHPFNVRDQLKVFASCGQNVLFHREARSRSRICSDSETPWSDKSYEFFLRVFLLGDSTYFREAKCELPNIYDNGYAGSPFNACLRGWILGYVQKSGPMTTANMRAIFKASGVPEQETTDAITVLRKYDLLRELKPFKGVLGLSIWGGYFLARIAYDLPYISTVWWTTYILHPYSLGTARELKATELRAYANRFMRWLRLEERIARSAMRDPSASVPELFNLVSFRVAYDLHRIDVFLRHGEASRSSG